MGFAGWIELVTLVLKFPENALALVRALDKTPVERHDELVKKIDEEQKKFQETGRPTWD